MIIGIAGNKKKPRVREAIQLLLAHLRDKNVPVVIDADLHDFIAIASDTRSEPLESLGQHCDLLTVFGGDGTLLAAATVTGASATPILGVNLGGLGFLAEVPLDEMLSTFDDIIAGRFAVIERMLLQVRIQQGDKSKTFYALNDLVIEKGLMPRLILVDVHVNGTYLNTYRCDGVIVATPTGSTAYSLSAGGPLLMPTMRAIIVTPICPHSLTVRPIVLSETSLLEIRLLNQDRPAQINIDGQNLLSLRKEDRITVAQAPYSIRWVDTHRRDFFNVLRTKLNWGIDLSALNTGEPRSN